MASELVYAAVQTADAQERQDQASDEGSRWRPYEGKRSESKDASQLRKRVRSKADNKSE